MPPKKSSKSHARSIPAPQTKMVDTAVAPAGGIPLYRCCVKVRTLIIYQDRPDDYIRWKVIEPGKKTLTGFGNNFVAVHGAGWRRLHEELTS